MTTVVSRTVTVIKCLSEQSLLSSYSVFKPSDFFLTHFGEDSAIVLRTEIPSIPANLHYFCVTDDSPPAEREPGEVVDSLVGKQVEYAKEDGSKRTGMVIHQVEAKPSVYFIKFDDDFHIYVYDLVKTS